MSLSIKETASVLKKAGFKDAEIPVMVAIGMGESGLNPGAHNPKYPDDSYGLFQINMLDEPGYELGKERRARYGLKSNEQLKDPLLNAKAALDIRNRQGLGAWSVYSEGIYKKHLPQVQRELAGGIPESPISIEKGVQSDKPKQGPPGPDTKSNYDPMLVAGLLEKQNQEQNKIKLLQSFVSRLNKAAEKPKSGSIDVIGLLQQAYTPQDLME
tara:strand:+ start:402 stop:1040 length:639 start_codon:yes stop_codon:yes gene_type:complete